MVEVARKPVPIHAGLEDGDMVVVVILSQQGDLRPFPEGCLWVANFKVPGVKPEQSEYFNLDFQGVPK